jgi:hypothetical protein
MIYFKIISPSDIVVNSVSKQLEYLIETLRVVRGYEKGTRRLEG